ncbi:GNAT family N-acetyltransferase [Solibacillus sp. MA9]|uniref:GNAT family N-acetyltransferase n=1 Tax=Solibacillus palustris TaxID=2908203 RepID=A0ABS9UCD0_9BACL|nr:GNAT family N-acetyltransferase [Solibacillus sp. MA9]MCH7321997.1 GNAT family N-acetyltransferase [Solibacillus sp. MA9]
MTLTFQNINIFAQLERETELYRHYQLDEVKDRYDSNFIEFLSNPTLSELQAALVYLQHKHRQSGRQFLKVVFPQDEEIPIELHQYLLSNQFGIGSLEMYAIKPNVFTREPICPEVTIEFVSPRTLEGYLEIHYKDALQWGESYAQARSAMLKRDYELKRTAQIVAAYNGKVVGSLDVIESANSAEIDNLFVLPAHQKKGIGTKLQQFVMKHYSEKIIILVADGDDTPREMYTKQGYSYIGKRFSALKTSLG